MRRICNQRHLYSLIACLALAACGGTDDGATPAAAAASGGGGGGGGAGCTDKVAALFSRSKGSYTATVRTFDNTSPVVIPATVAGFANGATATVTVNENCTVVIGAITMTYKDGSYAEFAGTGADAGKTQYDVDLTGTGVSSPHFEVFTSTKRGVSLFDPTKTQQGARFDE